MTLKYSITPENIHAHLFNIELTIDIPNPLGQVFSLPNWIPGSYLIRDFSKNIISINANSCGEDVLIKKLDKNHWITHPCEDELTLRYTVYAFDLSVRSAYLSSERAFFNGSSVFLKPLGFDNDSCELVVNYPINQEIQGSWDCATTLSLKSKNSKREIYSAKNYQDLIDHPVEMADFTRFEFKANSVNHAMTITGEHSTDIARLRADLISICEHHIDFFDKDVPFDEYLFLTLVRTKGYGGLEHQSSTSLICSRDDLPIQGNSEIGKKYIRFLALCSHEYFHAWWIKVIKPAGFHQLELNRENYTEQLWIFEGFTSYYDELSLLRANILSIEQYLTLFAQSITKLQKTSGRFKQSLAQSSFDAWTKFYQQDENAPNAIVSYYTKGALLAFVLDIEIRKCSDDKYCLDDVLKYIWKNYQSSGLEDNTVQDIVNKLTESDFSDFFNDYLYDVKDLPLLEAFNYVGIDCSFSNKKDELSGFGISIKDNSGFACVTHVLDDTCAQKSGLYVGDKITTIDNVKIQYKELTKAINKQSVDSTIELGILRDELPMQIIIKITKPKNTFCALFVKDNLDLKTQKRQQQWFFKAV